MRREVEQNAFMLVRQYQTDIGGMLQLLTKPDVPVPMKKVLMAAATIGAKLMVQILRDFDLPDAESLVLDISKLVKPEEIEKYQPPPPPPDTIVESMAYRDTPDAIKRQIELKAGYKPAMGALSDAELNPGQSPQEMPMPPQGGPQGPPQRPPMPQGPPQGRFGV
jgi:hypothetical protein